MIQMIVLILSTWLFQVNILETSSLNCSQYANDMEVLRTLSFLVPINPNSIDNDKTYALGYNNDTILVLNIANENFIPSTIFCLSSLRYLFVRDSNFCENQSSSSICQLSLEIERWSTSLEIMSFISTKITHLPSSFGKLKQLTQLELRNTNLMALPNSFTSLRSLSSLMITSSQLKSSPKTMGLLTSLSNIGLDNNINLRSIDSLTSLPNLVRLTAVNCSIKHIPIHLPNVSYIDMSNNKLINLNGIETIGSRTTKSKSFCFETNQIRSLPSQISSVHKLSALKIANNQLINLPSTLFDYPSLAYFDIQNNSFTSIRLGSIVTKLQNTNPSMVLLY
jgi:Leucine-rich repeat (LRR) protein